MFPNDANNRNATDDRLPLRDGDRQDDAVPEARRWGVAELGSDGGVHNFMKMLEDWRRPETLRYRGSMVSLYFSRQAVGIYRADATSTAHRPAAINFDYRLPVRRRSCRRARRCSATSTR